MVFAIAAAGALGAASRYVVDGFVQDRVEGVFPWGTWVINVSGSLVLGFVVGLGLYHGLTTNAYGRDRRGFPRGVYDVFDAHVRDASAV